MPPSRSLRKHWQHLTDVCEQITLEPGTSSVDCLIFLEAERSEIIRRSFSFPPEIWDSTSIMVPDLRSGKMVVCSETKSGGGQSGQRDWRLKAEQQVILYLRRETQLSAERCNTLLEIVDQSRHDDPHRRHESK